MFCFEYLLVKNSGNLVRQHARSHAMESVQGGESSPADIKRACDICRGPIENVDELTPIPHILIGKMFERCAGDDQTVEAPGQGQFVPARIMLRRQVSASIRLRNCRHHFYVMLRCSQQAPKLHLRACHVGHQV